MYFKVDGVWQAQQWQRHTHTHRHTKHTNVALKMWKNCRGVCGGSNSNSINMSWQACNCGDISKYTRPLTYSESSMLSGTRGISNTNTNAVQRGVCRLQFARQCCLCWQSHCCCCCFYSYRCCWRSLLPPQSSLCLSELQLQNKPLFAHSNTNKYARTHTHIQVFIETYVCTRVNILRSFAFGYAFVPLLLFTPL